MITKNPGILMNSSTGIRRKVIWVLSFDANHCCG